MKSIDAISIPVSDQKASKKFYGSLGFKVLEEFPIAGNKWWIRMGLEGCPTTIVLVTWFRKMPPGTLQGLSLVTDNLEREERALMAQGIIPSKIEEAATGRFFNFKDPDGNGLSIHDHSVTGPGH